MSKTTVPKRLKKIVALAESLGWVYSLNGEGHPTLTPPAGLEHNGVRARPITMSLSPSDHRGDRNAISQLRRCGVPVPR